MEEATMNVHSKYFRTLSSVVYSSCSLSLPVSFIFYIKRATAALNKEQLSLLRARSQSVQPPEDTNQPA